MEPVVSRIANTVNVPLRHLAISPRQRDEREKPVSLRSLVRLVASAFTSAI